MGRERGPRRVIEVRARWDSEPTVRHVALGFRRIANGSLNELETHLAVAQRLGYLDRDLAASLHDRCREAGHLLGALIRSLRAKEARSRPR
ncbi:MAG TPA: four helix bundle protein [Gemmatimonadaceae bacterium]|nr:four helix bundle protein [Gemmatimonadaceae bacterium]